MRLIDLRSDTVTQPTPGMRQAMAQAEVGDDVFGEDPTVNRLQEMAAKRVNKEAALFVASGTMANLVSLMTHCGRGDEVILGDQSHAFLFEQGGMASLGGIIPRTLRNGPDGKLELQDIEAAVRPDDVHFPRTRLIALENTHNRCNGSPLDPAYMHRVRDLATRYGLKIHVDGARIFNAAVALGMDVRELTAAADSVSFCLSKGLSAPVGSLLCGTREFIARARRLRKVVGGGLRQAGVLAAAGIVALEEMVDRLAEDHANARRFGEGLSHVDGITIDMGLIKTNILYVGITREDLTPQALSAGLKAEGILMSPAGPQRLRAVTHHPLTAEDIDCALKAFRKVME